MTVKPTDGITKSQTLTHSFELRVQNISLFFNSPHCLISYYQITVRFVSFGDHLCNNLDIWPDNYYKIIYGNEQRDVDGDRDNMNLIKVPCADA